MRGLPLSLALDEAPVMIVHRRRGRIRTADFGLQCSQAVGKIVELVFVGDAHAAVELVKIEGQLVDVSAQEALSMSQETLSQTPCSSTSTRHRPP